MKKISFFISSLLLISTIGFSQSKMDINGYARTYIGVGFEEPNNFNIIQNTLDLNFSKQASKVAFHANPFVYYYDDNRLELGLREMYLDMFFENLDLRIGKQQIIWGKADGVFITDVVSPKDLREFLLPDFDEIRTGVTSLKLNYYKKNHNLEFVWIPKFTPTAMPDKNSIWRPKMEFPITPTWDYSKSEVNNTLENSEVFLRYSNMSSFIDFEVVAGHFYYDDPSMHITKIIDTSTMNLSGLIVSPQYHSVNMAGGSFSIPLSSFVFRGEAAYYDGRYFQTANPAVVDAAIEKNNMHYMGGLDVNIGGYKFSTQFIQEYILDYEDGINNDEFESTMTFLAAKDFFREKLFVELFAYVGINNEDALVRAKLTYKFADGFETLLGTNLFFGDQGRFGQYDKNDMVYMKFKYSF